MTTAIDDVLAERQRQQVVEGHALAHDDEHSDGALAVAASCYANPIMHSDPRISVPLHWPWDAQCWKPTNRRRDLVKAAALLLAEIERIDRNNASHA